MARKGWTAETKKTKIAQIVRERLRRELVKTGLKKAPHDTAEQNDLADELTEWAKKPDSLKIEDFPLSKGISPYRFYKLAKTNEYFSDALDFSRYMVGSRREEKIWNKEMDYKFVLQTMGLYNREYREMINEKAALKEQAKQGSLTVIMEQFPSVKEVPDLKEKEENEGNKI